MKVSWDDKEGATDLQSDEIEDTTDIQIEHLCAGPVWRRIKWSAPSCTCIGHEDVQFLLGFLHFLYKLLNAFFVGNIGGDAYHSAFATKPI